MSRTKKSNADHWADLISKRLKELRKAKGYTSYESFAIDHGLDRKQYWRLENGSNVTIKTLVGILEIHDLDLIGFFKGMDSNVKKSTKI